MRVRRKRKGRKWDKDDQAASFGEIARAIGITPAGVHHIYVRAMRKLREGFGLVAQISKKEEVNNERSIGRNGKGNNRKAVDQS